jgi:hypothetical protein
MVSLYAFVLRLKIWLAKELTEQCFVWDHIASFRTWLESFRDLLALCINPKGPLAPVFSWLPVTKRKATKKESRRTKSAKTYPAQGLELEWPLQNPLEWNDRMSHRFPSQSSEYVEDGGRMQTWECRLNVESSIVETQSKCVLRLRCCEWLGSCFAKRGAFRVSRPLLAYPSAVWIASQQSTWDARQQESSGARILSLSLSMAMSSSFKASSSRVRISESQVTSSP